MKNQEKHQPVNHRRVHAAKILDLIDDLSLAGMPISGHIVAHKSGLD
jgi:UDP-3-O-acyl-N-acetylglucosamine deacetylase